ncbi:bifunctional 2-polyprenyl-6-hydroxyphenol methylase/3-demethylubiquinol 3-O-methyltransferase UbiG [Nocardia sp. 348MFTsu5.1]|uniref:class I SAM-dependent methyltransferase n=1 Tax=Nocardia sp. 348MFTsu5.1 TaxID=1172185 RepID=UPI000378A83B|nr:class I SAM-dependent methyltransferase [Nocardia sp. 348MFTsu5.1]
MNEADWDARYTRTDRVWSNNPNHALEGELTDLTPGTALDVGCGEGADARWLADRGWKVTAVDISSAALARAKELNDHPSISWTHADPVQNPPEPSTFDLVSMHYFPLVRTPGDVAARAFVGAVAPGGTLFVVSHDMTEDHIRKHAQSHPGDPDFNPLDYYTSHEFAAFLGDNWKVLVDRTQPRRVDPSSAGFGHVNDTVLRAVRIA